MNTLRLSLSIMIICVTSLFGCAPSRPPIPLGMVPLPSSLTSQDQAYGLEVFKQLTGQFPVSNDRYQNARVFRLVDRLISGTGGDPRDWKVYVLNDSSIANAAATRGNYVFVWTGMLNAVSNDDELATVVSHEIGHVLAGHTKATPQEEANQAITGLASAAAGSYVGATSGDMPGRLAQSVLTEVLKGFLVNPEAQRKEYEADQIGLFIMADAGFDPRAAVAFWRRASRDPRFASGIPEWFSTHPSTDNRLRRLESLVPEAERRL